MIKMIKIEHVGKNFIIFTHPAYSPRWRLISGRFLLVEGALSSHQVPWILIKAACLGSVAPRLNPDTLRYLRIPKRRKQDRAVPLSLVPTASTGLDANVAHNRYDEL